MSKIMGMTFVIPIKNCSGKRYIERKISRLLEEIRLLKQDRKYQSLIACSENIIFDDGEKVDLLFFFSPEREMDYLPLFKEIIELRNHQEQLQKIKLVKSCDEIYKYIEDVLE